MTIDKIALYITFCARYLWMFYDCFHTGPSKLMERIISKINTLLYLSMIFKIHQILLYDLVNILEYLHTKTNLSKLNLTQFLEH